jgi:hypothetical protein
MLKCPYWVLVLISYFSHWVNLTFSHNSGTWKSQPGSVEQAVEFALKNGYKHIDTASGYMNETGWLPCLIQSS